MPAPETGAAMTTAVTDLINALAVLPMIYSLRRKLPSSADSTRHWLRLMVSVSLASMLGFILHAFQWGNTGWIVCWAVLYIALFECLNTFLCVGWNTYTRALCPTRTQSLWLRLGALAMYILLMSLLLTGKNPIRLFLVYGILIAIPAFCFYAKLALKGHKGARILLLAFLPQLPGIFIQLRRHLSFTFLFPFDFNSIYHILLLGSILFFYLAARNWEGSSFRN